MQPPVSCCRDHGFARQLRSMQEEQQGNGEVGEVIHHQRRRAAAWQLACRDDGRDQRQGEILRQELGSRHTNDLFARTGFELARSRSQRASRGSGNMPQ